MHHSPLQMLNSYLINGERRNLSSRLFYEPWSRYIANQSGSAKETVSPKIGENFETLRQGFDWYQSSLSNYDESTWKLDIKIDYKYIQTRRWLLTIFYFTHQLEIKIKQILFLLVSKSAFDFRSFPFPIEVK